MKNKSVVKKTILTTALVMLMGISLHLPNLQNLKTDISLSTFTDTTDLPSSNQKALNYLAEKSIVIGNNDGSFSPDRKLNRAEVSKIIVLATKSKIDTSDGPHFPDVSKDEWFYPYIETMYNRGWITGYPDGKFEPDQTINRAELAKMIVNAFEAPYNPDRSFIGYDVHSDDWFYPYVRAAVDNELMKTRGILFFPGSDVSRIETVQTVYNTMKLGGTIKTAAPVLNKSTGTLTIRESEINPKSSIVPHNASALPYLVTTLEASEGIDINISELAFQRRGLGSSHDFDRIWLEIEGERITHKKSISIKDEVIFYLNPPLEIKEKTSIELSLIASHDITDDKRNVGHTNQFILQNESIKSDANKIEGTFPIQGGALEIINYNVAGVVFTPRGNGGYVSVGDSFTEIGKFRLQNATSARKKVQLKEITLRNIGKADLYNDLENIELYNANRLSEGVLNKSIRFSGDYLTFELNDIDIEGGDSITFSIRADILSDDGGQSIQLRLENAEDLHAVESGSDFGIAVMQSYDKSISKSAGTLESYTIRSGDLTVSRTRDSLSNQNYSPGSHDMTLMNVQMNLSQAIDVDGLRIQLGSNIIKNSNGTTLSESTNVNELNRQFMNFRLYVNDRYIDYVNTFSGTNIGNAYLEFDSRFEIPGTSILTILADATQNAINGTKLKLRFEADDFISPEYVSDGDMVPDDQLIGVVEGSFIEISESSISVIRTDGYADESSLVMGANDFMFMRFILDNNNVGQINISSIKLEAITEGSTANLTASIFVDGVQIGSSKDLGSNNTATFNDISLPILSSGQEEVEIIINSHASASVPDSLKINIVEILAENIDSGRTIEVMNTEGNIISQGSPLASAKFNTVDSGVLSVSKGSTIYSDILIAEATNQEVLKIRFNATDDKITVHELSLMNDIDQDNSADYDPSNNSDVESRINFKLFDNKDRLLKEKRMTNGKVVFQLGSGDRIQVPKDNSTFATIKVDLSNINRSNQTGKRLQLSLDRSTESNEGVKAVTHATGTDISIPTSGWETSTGNLSGEEYVLYRSEIAINHASDQPQISGPSPASQEVYRFTVSSLGNSTELGRVTLNLNLQGMQKQGGANLAAADFLLKTVQSNGSVSSQEVGTIVVNDASSKTAQIQIDFNDQRFSKAETKSYALFLDNTENDGTESNDDTISVNILNDNTYVAPGTKADQLTSQVLVWSDESDVLHSDTTSDWMNGYLLNVSSTSFINRD